MFLKLLTLALNYSDYSSFASETLKRYGELWRTGMQYKSHCQRILLKMDLDQKEKATILGLFTHFDPLTVS